MTSKMSIMQGKNEDLLLRLLNLGNAAERGLTKTVKDEEIIALCNKVKDVFTSQAVFIEIDPPVRVCGDTHGQFGDLLRLFNRGGFPPTANYLFLGDYVDRGRQNLETILILFVYKVKYPNNFFLLRGNHECPNINRVYGFMEECSRRYPTNGQRLWQAFQDAFNMMPLSAMIGDRILCMHGGISPHLRGLKDLRDIQRPNDCTGDTLEMDLLWADPVPGCDDFKLSTRGASYTFGEIQLNNACQMLNIDLVARAHQVVQDGYEFFGSRKLVTIFSAPHYCGQFDNAAAMMIVDENLVCSFQILRPTIGRGVTKTVPTAAGGKS